MGYSVFRRDGRFVIRRDRAAAAFAALRALRGREPILDQSGAHFSFVDADAFGRAETLEDALWAWRWEPRMSPDGDVVELIFQGESLGDEDTLFAALAPFVDVGSYVEMIGEDGATWRWSFHEGGVHVLRGTITFEPPADHNRLDRAALPGPVRFRSSLYVRRSPTDPA